MNFKYAVFDLDGTLLDTQKYWDKYEREILGKRFGIDMFNDENGNYIPFTGLKAMFDRAMKLTGKEISLEEVIDELYDKMRDVYRSGDIETMPKALDFLKALKAEGVKTAIATATDIDVCKPALERMGLLPFLDELVCTSYVGKNKYHPDVFDKALELIGGNKEETMVFEDSLYAANTLKANGFRYTIIEEEGSLCCVDELKDGCENYIKSYEELYMNETVTSVSRFLLENDNFVIGIHANPDGDCFGSGCGLAGALKKLGKNVMILSPDPIPKRLQFLNYSEIQALECREGYDKIKDEKHTYITVDVASDHLLGEVADFFQQNNKYAIDHHEKNTITAQKLYLDSIASAAGEIVYKIICELEEWANETIWDEKIASSVFGAISSDTGCFKYGNTTPETHRIAASLLEKNADARDINYRLFDLKSPKQIACEGFAYGNIELYEDGKISFIYISDDILSKIGATHSDTETISQIGRGVEGVQIAAFMRDKSKGEFKISVRCNIDTDLSVLCASLGIGGGHKKAAGCTVFTDSPQKAKEMFLEKAKDYIE